MVAPINGYITDDMELSASSEVDEQQPRETSSVYSPSRRLSARTRTFIAWAKQHLSDRVNTL